jgi:pimeloyl-ACP methyl ester carboxylesterase
MEETGIERAHLVGQSYGGAVILQVTVDTPGAAHTLALLEPALPSILFRAPEGGGPEEEESPGALYMSGDKAGAIDTFAQGVISPGYRAAFDEHLPPGWFDRWVEATDTVFQSDLPDLQAWRFAGEDAAGITQPVLNLRGANTTVDFREIYDAVRAWIPHAESDVVPDASHAMMQMNPSATAQRLAAFFSKHPL